MTLRKWVIGSLRFEGTHCNQIQRLMDTLETSGTIYPLTQTTKLTDKYLSLLLTCNEFRIDKKIRRHVKRSQVRRNRNFMYLSIPTSPNPNAEALEDKLDKRTSYIHGLSN